MQINRNAHTDTRLLSEMCLVNGGMVAMPTDGAVNKHKSDGCCACGCGGDASVCVGVTGPLV